MSHWKNRAFAELPRISADSETAPRQRTKDTYVLTVRSSSSRAPNCLSRRSSLAVSSNSLGRHLSAVLSEPREYSNWCRARARGVAIGSRQTGATESAAGFPRIRKSPRSGSSDEKKNPTLEARSCPGNADFSYPPLVAPSAFGGLTEEDRAWRRCTSGGDDRHEEHEPSSREKRRDPGTERRRSGDYSVRRRARGVECGGRLGGTVGEEKKRRAEMKTEKARFSYIRTVRGFGDN